MIKLDSLPDPTPPHVRNTGLASIAVAALVSWANTVRLLLVVSVLVLLLIAVVTLLPVDLSIGPIQITGRDK